MTGTQSVFIDWPPEGINNLDRHVYRLRRFAFEVADMLAQFESFQLLTAYDFPHLGGG
jgi:hypothetical protein